jgi:hypothetical protein
VSENGFLYGTAVYADAKPGVITVTQDGQVYAEAFQGPREGPPRIRHLHPTPWKNVPGQGWAQDQTGAFHVRVYRHKGE